MILTGAWAADPYIFGFTAFGAAAVSGGFVLVSLFLRKNQFPWALLAGIPTALSFWLLSTYKWA